MLLIRTSLLISTLNHICCKVMFSVHGLMRYFERATRASYKVKVAQDTSKFGISARRKGGGYTS